MLEKGKKGSQANGRLLNSRTSLKSKMWVTHNLQVHQIPNQNNVKRKSFTELKKRGCEEWIKSFDNNGQNCNGIRIELRLDYLESMSDKSRTEAGNPSRPCKQRQNTGIPAYSTAIINALSLCFPYFYSSNVERNFKLECQFNGLPIMIENVHTLNGIQRAGPQTSWFNVINGPRPLCGWLDGDASSTVWFLGSTMSLQDMSCTEDRAVLTVILPALATLTVFFFLWRIFITLLRVTSILITFFCTLKKKKNVGIAKF